jgi:aconitate hydratase
MYDYLAATKREAIGDFSREYAKELREDEGAEYDELIEINLSELEPHINGPFTPDLATPISKFKEAVKANKWPEELKVGLIGSCTNSSYEDMTRAASIAQDAMDHGIKAKSLFTVTPGSEQRLQSSVTDNSKPSRSSAAWFLPMLAGMYILLPLSLHAWHLSLT